MTNENTDILSAQKNRFYLELMIVLSIVILLVALAIPIFLSAVQTARDQVDEANLRILNSATLQWLLADEANDPLKLETWQLQAELTGKYLEGWPVSPNNKRYELEQGQWVAK